MSEKIKKISRMKYGIIDEVHMNAIGDAATRFLGMESSLRTLLTGAPIKSESQVLAMLTKRYAKGRINFTRFNGVLETNVWVVWYYEFKLIEVDNILWGDALPIKFETEDPQQVLDTAGFHNAYTSQSGFAWNLAEITNLESFEANQTVFGVNIEGAAYPEGFFPMPSAVTAEGSLREGWNTKVLLTRFRDSQGDVGFFFDRQGTHDGGCTSDG